MWQLTGDHAELNVAGFSGVVALREPWLGFHWTRWNSQPLNRCVLQPSIAKFVNGASPLADAYVRGCDLVVSYHPLPGEPVHWQLYWRVRTTPLNVASSPAAISLELLLSAHADALHSDPATYVHTESTSSPRMWREQPPGWIDDVATPSLWLTTAEHGSVYAEMMHPHDVARFVREPLADGVDLQWHIFPESLEKGVIRRARLCGFFLPAPGAEESVLALRDQFLAEPLPLTT